MTGAVCFGVFLGRSIFFVDLFAFTYAHTPYDKHGECLKSLDEIYDEVKFHELPRDQSDKIKPAHANQGENPKDDSIYTHRLLVFDLHIYIYICICIHVY